MTTEDFNRKSGYYWIKRFRKSEWQIAEWNFVTQEWSFCGSEFSLPSEDMYEIDEELILKK